MEALIEALFSLVIEVFGELILNVVMTALAEVGVHLTRRENATSNPPNRFLLVIGYALLGLIAGGLSLLVFPDALAHGPQARLAALLLGPLGAAASTVLLGRWRVRRGQAPAGIDRFMYAYLFTLATACVRYAWAG